MLAGDLTARPKFWAPMPFWIRKKSRHLLRLCFAEGCNSSSKISLWKKKEDSRELELLGILKLPELLAKLLYRSLLRLDFLDDLRGKNPCSKNHQNSFHIRWKHFQAQVNKIWKRRESLISETVPNKYYSPLQILKTTIGLS